MRARTFILSEGAYPVAALKYLIVECMGKPLNTFNGGLMYIWKTDCIFCVQRT